MEILKRTDLPTMPYQTLDLIMKAPHLKDIGFFETIEHQAEGEIINVKLWY